MTTLKIILASTRPGSSGPAIGCWIAEQAATAAFTKVEVVDLAQVNLPFLDEPEHPRFGRYTQPHTLAWSRTVDEADALIVVTPEYNGGFPAPLKNALDFLHAEWRNKALGIVSYSGGPHGGTGAAAMLAPVTATLGLVTADAAVAIPKAAARITDGIFVAGDVDNAQLATMLDQLIAIDQDLAPSRTRLAMVG
jgi:NAD(P)H-dependent FMN reductase